jgi:hypothetical protein
MPFENPFLNTLRGTTVPTFTASGTQDIGQAGNFFRTLLGGNRQAIMQQASPAANAAREAADAARREAAARGTARTGGAAAQSAQSEDEIRKQIDTLIGQQQAGAAQSLAGIGSEELNTMMNALNIGTQAAQSDINSRRAATASMLSSLIGGAANVATGGVYGALSGAAKALSPTPSISMPPISTPTYSQPLGQIGAAGGGLFPPTTDIAPPLF